jgi:hypothetical protein
VRVVEGRAVVGLWGRVCNKVGNLGRSGRQTDGGAGGGRYRSVSGLDYESVPWRLWEKSAVTLDIIPLLRCMSDLGRLDDTMYLSMFAMEEGEHTEMFRRWFDELTQAEPVNLAGRRVEVLIDGRVTLAT